MAFQNTSKTILSRVSFKPFSPEHTAPEALKMSWKYRAQNSLSIDTKYFTFRIELDEHRLTQIDRFLHEIEDRSWTIE